MEIKIQYLDDTIEPLGFVEGEKSDWIDLRAAMDYRLKAGEHKLIHLGVAMQLPEGYEAVIAPRSSTFKKWGILQPNSPGVVDESYCGPDDWWFMSAYATRDITIAKGSRICQFRIQKKMGRDVTFTQVDKLENENRGGHGSTGDK